MNWVSSAEWHQRSGAFQGGISMNGEILYICRAQVHLHDGELDPHLFHDGSINYDHDIVNIPGQVS